GGFLPGFPRQVEDLQFLMAPAVADLNGDGSNEVVYGSAGGLLHAWNALGISPGGWPKNTGQWILGSPAIGDVDGDGYLDVVASTREGWVFAWSTRGPADRPVEWASQFHDAANTGNYETSIPVQVGPPAVPAAGVPEKTGGCCKDDSTAEGGLLLLLPLGLFGWGRRRQGSR
ncbi:MAG TPA: alkaline serine protease, partial [Deltaproteobacteria bacterium]|nr:alkaline serine protease [Deltaproteobacteria bacterium]